MNIEDLKEFLMWCSIINVSLLIFSAIFCISLSDWAYAMHSKMFKISREAFNTSIYAFLGIFKIIVIVFNIVPWLALEIVR